MVLIIAIASPIVMLIGIKLRRLSSGEPQKCSISKLYISHKSSRPSRESICREGTQGLVVHQARVRALTSTATSTTRRAAHASRRVNESVYTECEKCDDYEQYDNDDCDDIVFLHHGGCMLEI